MMTETALAFDVLSDAGAQAAQAYGLAFPLPQPLRAIYTELGHPLPSFNAAAGWTLPVPATFVIDRTGRIRLTHVETGYRRRLEPRAALAALP